MKRLLALLLVVLVPVLVRCSIPPSDARIGIDTPSFAQFSQGYQPGSSAATSTSGVADLLDESCGTLDCHGNAQRNLVMWGCYGLRLDPNDAPGCASMGGTDTTQAEYEATFRSLVALEPQVMSDVVANHDSPNELTFVRKAFGEEAHKGGEIFPLASPADTCIGTWLWGDMDAGACGAALNQSLATTLPSSP